MTSRPAIRPVLIGGGALMHAAGIAGRDGAFLVERTILRPVRGDGWIVGATPWPGEGRFADNRSVPLGGLILLEQSDRDELQPISPARVAALLYRCHFPPPRLLLDRLGGAE